MLKILKRLVKNHTYSVKESKEAGEYSDSEEKNECEGRQPQCRSSRPPHSNFVKKSSLSFLNDWPTETLAITDDPRDTATTLTR